jgi:hypothetical protein
VNCAKKRDDFHVSTNSASSFGVLFPSLETRARETRARTTARSWHAPRLFMARLDLASR